MSAAPAALAHGNEPIVLTDYGRLFAAFNKEPNAWDDLRNVSAELQNQPQSIRSQSIVQHLIRTMNSTGSSSWLATSPPASKIRHAVFDIFESPSNVCFLHLGHRCNVLSGAVPDSWRLPV
jgi:hypothetical protein